MLDGKQYVTLGPVIQNSIWFSFLECIQPEIGKRESRGHLSVGFKMRRFANETLVNEQISRSYSKLVFFLEFNYRGKIEVLDD